MFRKMPQGRFATLSGCRLDLNISEYGLEAGLCEPSVPLKSGKYLTQLSNYQL
jgi:hypothetical protein